MATTTTTSLVNETNLFSSIVTRLFTGNVREIVEELLQNAQRAGATRVDVRFLQHSVVFTDNGHGLANGIEDLRSLLVLAESSYQDGTVMENQSPMGIGLYSLIAHKEVEQIAIDSGSISFSIRTQRWLNDSAYREGWQQRVDSLEKPEAGLSLLIKASPGFLESVRACLSIGVDGPVRYYADVVDYQGCLNPVSGYADMMQVYLDGNLIEAALPNNLVLLAPRSLVKEYQDNEIHISPFSAGHYNHKGCLVINWYGQLIFDTSSVHKFCAYLVVRQGKPVTPRAPTRAGVIDDEARKALWQWVEDRIFETICGMEKPSVELVTRLYAINESRAQAECPFALVQPWLPLPADASFESHDEYAGENTDAKSQEVGKEQVVRKDTLGELLILDEGVTCFLRGDHRDLWYVKGEKHLEENPELASQYFPEDYEIGLGSFLRATGLAAYKAVLGVPDEHVSCFVWQPGQMADDYYTTDLGRWAIQNFETPEDESKLIDMLAWNPFGEEAAPIFVASRDDSWSIDNVNWIIGLRDRSEMVPFLKQYAGIAWYPDDEEYDDSQDSYTGSVEDLIISYLPDTISDGVRAKHLPGEIQKLLPAGYDAGKATYTFVYQQGQNNTFWVTGIKLAFPDGFEKEISFY